MSPLTVWYNTKCPVCDAGIDRTRKRLVRAARSGAIIFRDINLEPDALAVHGASINDVRRRLHGRDEDGAFFVGADCAIEIWRRTPGHGWLAAVFEKPGFRHLARFGYDRFADMLYAWNRWHGRW
jgi:predicted DCC family thiol-disulfide oxidoreductase YuxK